MAQESAAALLVGHGDHHGQVTALLGGQHSGACLLQVGHGLDEHKVCPGLHAGRDDLLENVHRLFKLQRTGGLQQLADGAHIQRHQRPSVRGLARNGHGGGHHLRHRRTHMRQLFPVGTEGVGVDDLRPGLHIAPVNVQQPIRMLQRGQLRVFPRLQPSALEHSTHAAVQYYGRIAAQQFTKFHNVHLTFDKRSRPGRDSPRSFVSGVVRFAHPRPEWR